MIAVLIDDASNIDDDERFLLARERLHPFGTVWLGNDHIYNMCVYFNLRFDACFSVLKY